MTDLEKEEREQKVFRKKNDLSKWARSMNRQFSKPIYFKPIYIPKITFFKSYKPGNYSTRKLSHGGCHITNRVLFSRGGKKQANFFQKLQAHLNYIQREAQYQNKTKGLESEVKDQCDFTLKSLEKDLTTAEVLQENPKIYCRHQMIFSPEGMEKLSDGQVDDLMYSIKDYIKNNNKYNADFKFYYSLHRDTDHHHCHIVLTSPGFLFLGKKDIFQMREIASKEVHQCLVKEKFITFKERLKFFNPFKTLEVNPELVQKQELAGEVKEKEDELIRRGLKDGKKSPVDLRKDNEGGIRQSNRENKQPGQQLEPGDLKGPSEIVTRDREGASADTIGYKQSNIENTDNSARTGKRNVEVPSIHSSHDRDSEQRVDVVAHQGKNVEQHQHLDRENESKSDIAKDHGQDGRGLRKEDGSGVQGRQGGGDLIENDWAYKAMKKGLEEGGKYELPKMGHETIIIGKEVEKQMLQGFYEKELDEACQKKIMQDMLKGLHPTDFDDLKKNVLNEFKGCYWIGDVKENRPAGIGIRIDKVKKAGEILEFAGGNIITHKEITPDQAKELAQMYQGYKDFVQVLKRWFEKDKNIGQDKNIQYGGREL